jgi:hypothetical protein
MQYQFDASTVDPAQGIELWPDNEWIKVIATGHKPMPLRDKEGQGRLVWTLKAVDGPLAGKTQFLGMNLWIDNTNGAQDIAKRELAALVWVTLGASQGRLAMNDFSELENIPFYILSKKGFNNNTKQASQDWGGYKDINGNDAGKQGAGQQQAAPQFGAPAAAPQQQFAAAPQQAAFGAPQQAPAAFGQPQQQQQQPQQQAFQQPQPAAFGAPAAAPGFAPQAAPAFGAPQGFAAPPATSAPPAFGQPQAAPQQGGFAPPPGQAPAGSPPWGPR